MAPPFRLARGPGGSTRRPPRKKMPRWVDILWVFFFSFSLTRAVAQVFIAWPYQLHNINKKNNFENESEK
jgi:hypothetical protein